MQNRRSVVDRLAAMAEKQAFKQALKDGVPKDEAAKDRSSVLPNRQNMRGKGIGITQKYGRPFGRLTGFKLAPSSFHTLVAVHSTGSDGKLRKFVVSRERFENKDV